MALGLGIADYDELEAEDGLETQEPFEGNSKGHLKLIKSLQRSLQDKGKGRGTIRREAAPDVAEFSAVKRRVSSKSLNLNGLLESVKESGEDLTAGKVTKLVKAPSTQSIKTLETPLEKPDALKTRRTVLYDEAKKDVSRWNSVVYHNRLADQLVFPLNSDKKIPRKGAKDVSADFIPMTPLEEEMAKVLYGEEYLKERKAALQKPVGPTDAEAYMLSVEEALAVHSEMARLRALQSYEMSKAKRRNKIKSKKYHRLLRKDKIKKQLKDFEELQQTDPEAAMVKLTELEESRVEERMSLKHRNTSKWAKMQSARAKYNRDSRMALSEQLKISRDLTQKVQESSSDEEDDVETDLPALVRSSNSMNNPWMLNSEAQGMDKLQLYYSGYKKLWEDINAKKEKESKKLAALNTEIKDIKNDEIVGHINTEKTDQNDNDDLIVAKPANKSDSVKKSKKSKLEKKEKRKEGKKGKKVEESVVSSEDEDTEGGFTEHDLEGLFEKAENKLKSQALKKLKDIEKNERALKRSARTQANRKERLLKNKKNSKQKRGDVDEIMELEVNPEEQNFENFRSGEASLDLMTMRKEGQNLQNEPKAGPELINPDNYLKISKEKGKKRSKFSGEGIKELNFVDNNEADDSDDENSQGMIIADAFEDDDVVSEFRKQKGDEIDASKPKDIDLHLPGWGEWGGKGIVPNPQKRKRFIIKAPPQAPRKDARLSHVILNEEASEKIKDHQVRDVPFPFKTVKDFEKTIRAPIGRTWLPEQSTKDLIAPKVITRLGSVIQPIDEDVLVKSSDGRQAKVSKEFKVPLSIKRLAKVKK